MELLETLVVHHGSETKYIKLYHGDLTAIPAAEAVDLLVVSAFPNDYLPTRSSLIGALNLKGLSVSALAQDKEVDLRQSFSCWLSKEIHPVDPGLQFRRILCFEPLVRGRPPEVVGDIFRSIMPFVYDDPPIKSIAMPVVASGDQQIPLEVMFAPLLDAAVHWLAHGIPVETIKIVEYWRAKAERLREVFVELKSQYAGSSAEQSTGFSYDLFVSYSHQDRTEVEFLIKGLQVSSPDVHIFFDKMELKVGSAWQEELSEALEDCRKVVTVYSPTYLQSKVCQEEFNIARLRHRDSQAGVILPIYLRSTELPAYMRLIQYIDCREGDLSKIGAACQELLSSLTG